MYVYIHLLVYYIRDEVMDEKMKAKLYAIAKSRLCIETLDTRNSDRLDFHEVSVWSVLEALEEAYMEGMIHEG